MKKTFFLILSVSFFISPANSLNAASFECNNLKVLNRVEKQICHNETLSVLDETLSHRYKDLKSSIKTTSMRPSLLNQQEFQQLIQNSQKIWIKYIRDEKQFIRLVKFEIEMM